MSKEIGTTQRTRRYLFNPNLKLLQFITLKLIAKPSRSGRRIYTLYQKSGHNPIEIGYLVWWKRIMSLLLSRMFAVGRHHPCSKDGNFIWKFHQARFSFFHNRCWAITRRQIDRFEKLFFCWIENSGILVLSPNLLICCWTFLKKIRKNSYLKLSLLVIFLAICLSQNDRFEFFCLFVLSNIASHLPHHWFSSSYWRHLGKTNL